MTRELSPVAAAPLDPHEEQVRLPGPHPGLSLFLGRLPPCGPRLPQNRAVLYVHGGTFPSALSIAHRFDGRSWRDELCAAGFSVWGLAFHGFSLSDPYPEMTAAAEGSPPLGRAEDASRQLERAVSAICDRECVERISLVAHSWGTIVSGLFAGRRPERVDRMVFFGPIARREPKAPPVRLPGWRLISLADQWSRFTETVPEGEPLALLRRHFEEWGERYLDGDRQSRTRSPAAVKVPSGAFQDIFDAWAGALAYDPGLVRAPVAIIRGAWDGMCTDEDARWLFDGLAASPVRRDIKIGRGTHLMHLKASRYALYRETEAFLSARDTAPAADRPEEARRTGDSSCSP